MRQVIRLTESRLKHIIKETVMRILEEGITIKSVYDRLNNYLSDFGDVHLSKFYSDDNNIVVSANKEAYYAYKDNIIRLMSHYGSEYYDAGGNGDYIMMSFREK